jgi:hypothetical protein
MKKTAVILVLMFSASIYSQFEFQEIKIEPQEISFNDQIDNILNLFQSAVNTRELNLFNALVTNDEATDSAVTDNQNTLD